MNFDLTAEQKLIQKSARDFADRVIEPAAQSMEKGEPLPADIPEKMAKARLLGLLAPKKYGGSEVGYLGYILATEQFCYPISAIAWIAGICNTVAECINHFGTEELKQKYIPPICSGKSLGSIVFTEPGTGSDPKSLATTAVLDGDFWVINGTKRFNSLGAFDGPAITVAKENELINCIIVDKNCEGYSSSKLWDFMGYRGLPTVDTFMSNVRVPKGNLLGQRGKGFDILLKMISGARISSCARCLAIGQAALDEAIKYSKQRTRRGSPIAAMMSIQGMIAEIVSRVEAARWMTYRVAFLREKDSDVTMESAMAKLFVSRMAREVADMSLQVHGAYGFTKDFKIERIYRAAKEGEIVEGTSEIQRTIIANYILA